MRKTAEKMTLEKLAGMVANGFAETAKKTELDSFRMEVNERFDRIENLILAEHRHRIEKLEEQMKEMRNALAL